jgi:uncharacterized membrane protein
MNDIAFAISLHLIAVVIWIGGVGLVTTVLMPSIRRQYAPEARLAAFLLIEQRFVWQARVAVLVAGASGFWMLQRLQLWSAFALPQYWWLPAMVGLWAIFAAMLFIVEPLYLHRHLAETADPANAFSRMERLHRILFALSLLVIGGAAAGSHGL